MTFEQYIINKYPLYAKVDFESINVSWGEVFKLHDEWLLQLADNTEFEDIQPVIVTVEMHDPKFTQINHLKTNG